MNRLLGSYLRFLHDARNHKLIEVRIATWLNFGLLLLAALALLGALPGGRTIGYVLVAIIVGMLLSDRVARRQYYVHFIPGALPQTDQSDSPLWPEDKVLHRASGHFQAENQDTDLTDLTAYYRTLETREHAIMARKTPTQFYGLGAPDPDLLHMWYIFIAPGDIKRVRAGVLYFGSRPRPAIQIDYTRFERQGAKSKPTVASAFLSFDSEGDCRQVYDDLMLDAGGPAHKPWRRPAAETLDGIEH